MVSTPKSLASPSFYASIATLFFSNFLEVGDKFSIVIFWGRVTKNTASKLKIILLIIFVVRMYFDWQYLCGLKCSNHCVYIVEAPYYPKLYFMNRPSRLRASSHRSLKLAWAGQSFVQCPTGPAATLLSQARWSATLFRLPSSALLSSARSIWASGGLLCATSRWGFHPLSTTSVAAAKPVEGQMGCQMTFRLPFLLHTPPPRIGSNFPVVDLVMRTHP